jgi:hypothetical protein
MIIADYFGVSLEWLVTKHDFSTADAALVGTAKKGK